MASLIKIILAMHQQVIPGVPGFTTLDEHISLTGSPFQITAENRRWEPLTDNDGKILPRRAAINSYGLGGVNAHMVLEEYLPPQEEAVHPPSANSPEIAVFSAKNPEQLQAVVRQMLKLAQAQKALSISDIAYTLQLGREAMDSRAALVVNNREELVRGLKTYLESGKENKEFEASIPIFTGNLELEHPDIHSLLDGNIGETVKQALLAENNPKKLAFYWAKGGTISWESLHEGKGSRRISLPTYPFEKGVSPVKKKAAKKVAKKKQ
jgi:acyl transferase domain-containing protein